MHEGGACESGSCVGATCGRAGFDAIHEKEMVLPLDSVQVELC
jgi:hypothetical protein